MRQIENHKTYGPVHMIVVLIAYEQMPLINAHADTSSKARGLSSTSLHCVCKQ